MAKRKREIVDNESIALARALRRARIEDGLSQQELADRLKTSQPTLSKILKNIHSPRGDLSGRIRVFLGRRWPLYGIGSKDWLVLVRDAAEKSEKFATLLISAMAMIKEENEL